jgi:hypothetical protein
MEIPPSWVTCDGCGLPGSPAHIAERLNRLELATRFRPIHISVLFIAAAPLLRPEDDFYGPPETREFFDPFLAAVEIPIPGSRPHESEEVLDEKFVRLNEFQHRGYYLSYLSECPLSREGDEVERAISRLGTTLLRRIRFNYKPKQIVILGSELGPLLEVLKNGGMTAVSVLEIPRAGEVIPLAQFRAALASLAPRDNLSSECDRIQIKQP